MDTTRFVQKSQITSAVPSLFISGQRPHPCWIGPPGQTRTPAGLNIAQLTRKYYKVILPSRLTYFGSLVATNRTPVPWILHHISRLILRAKFAIARLLNWRPYFVNSAWVTSCLSRCTFVYVPVTADMSSFTTSMLLFRCVSSNRSGIRHIMTCLPRLLRAILWMKRCGKHVMMLQTLHRVLLGHWL